MAEDTGSAGSQGQPLAAGADTGGSNRKASARWRYAPGVGMRSGFIELKDMTMEPPELLDRLQNVDGVTKVAATEGTIEETLAAGQSSSDAAHPMPADQAPAS